MTSAILAGLAALVGLATVAWHRYRRRAAEDDRDRAKARADLAEVRAALALVAKATPGPWRTFGRWPNLAVVSGHVRPRIVASLASASDDVDDTPKDAAAIVALRNAAPAIAAAVEELNAARAEIAALNRQVCRLTSGDEIEGDRLCQHHAGEAAALALLSDELAAHAETSRDLDALLTALGAQVTPGGQTEGARQARLVADGMRLARREVPADVEAAIADLCHEIRSQSCDEDSGRATASGDAEERSAARALRAAIAKDIADAERRGRAAGIERARAEGRAESPAAPATVGGLLATAPAGSVVEWMDDGSWYRYGDSLWVDYRTGAGAGAGSSSGAAAAGAGSSSGAAAAGAGSSSGAAAAGAGSSSGAAAAGAGSSSGAAAAGAGSSSGAAAAGAGSRRSRGGGPRE